MLPQKNRSSGGALCDIQKSAVRETILCVTLIRIVRRVWQQREKGVAEGGQTTKPSLGKNEYFLDLQPQW